MSKFKPALDAIKKAGFTAYVRKPLNPWNEITYAIYTDGERLGYIQLNLGGFSISTMHKPSPNIGTGFRMIEFSNLSKDELTKGFFLAPHWVRYDELKYVKKWESVDQWLNSSKFNQEYMKADDAEFLADHIQIVHVA